MTLKIYKRSSTKNLSMMMISLGQYHEENGDKSVLVTLHFPLSMARNIKIDI